ncbi:hypothetical protein [Xanthomonas euvesicatoria]|uniref:hypothetical protein n=1 Tax=Xanthomonas euvesicatoria TaxID=456327 RepID=UPI001E338E22|nr:hypothetical protein [Xanthomonas euvesicatoria]
MRIEPNALKTGDGQCYSPSRRHGGRQTSEAAGYDTRGKNLRKKMKKKRKAAHVARQGKKTGKMRGALARKAMS